MNEIVSYSIISVIGLALTIVVWFLRRNNDKRKAQDAIDKEIDAAHSFDDFVRIDDMLRDK